MATGSEWAVRVVAIDDDEQHLKFIATILTQERVQIFATTNPFEGLELVRKNHPQLLFVDLLMPEMGGMELLQ